MVGNLVYNSAAMSWVPINMGSVANRKVVIKSSREISLIFKKPIDYQ
jgi:hypothetical protein